MLFRSNWNNIEDIEVQITEATNFAQVGQNQKDFNKNVSDYKINADLKNNEQDDRMSDIESENVSQNDLINSKEAWVNKVNKTNNLDTGNGFFNNLSVSVGFHMNVNSEPILVNIL